ncbi:MAG: metallophosphoesterase [Janthinobacterium lividum]
MSNRLGRLGLLAGGAGLGLLAYAAGVEPYAIETVHWDLFAPRLPEAFEGYTIYQISDLHMRQMGRRERLLESLLRGLPQADLVAVTGDLIHTPAGIGPFLTLAQAFQARDGAYAIFGNSEHKNGVRPYALSRTLSENGIVPLMNQHVLLMRGDSKIVLAGVDDPVNDKDDICEALKDAPANLFTLLLMHSPDSIAEAVLRGVDVVLSGHTHGGQIRLPWYGALYTHSLLGRRMSDGYYSRRRLRHAIGIRPGRTQLYVTRGIGISGLALRFLTRPELTIITLRRGLPHIARAN